MAKPSRVPSAVGAIPVVGDLVRRAEGQARWAQDLLEQNARMMGQLPATMRTLNDSLERFNQTVERLDAVVARIESTAEMLLSPLQQVAPNLDRIVSVATDTQQQVALLTTTIDRLTGLLNDLPGAGFMRRLAGGRPTAVEVDDPSVP